MSEGEKEESRDGVGGAEDAPLEAWWSAWYQCSCVEVRCPHAVEVEKAIRKRTLDEVYAAQTAVMGGDWMGATWREIALRGSIVTLRRPATESTGDSA